ncbi:nSTAND1 domain-containing NTPase [Streptomyces sp. B21-083]|uniref:nSTAND1 domain-containing NTPase n=1 Tax=Streptomyces sp. B21-083 TaxID=3039410 RepID=UPI002FF19438
MGRPERPLDPDAGPVQRLAHELRELRGAAGGPSYRTMTEVAGCSVSSLSEAAAGRKLPSFTVFQGYVRACGGDLGEWEPRWKDADAQAAGTVREEAPDAAPPYRGLARFEPGDHALFFGRDRLVEEARELVCTHRFAVLFGASGSGKSSLLRAGLIPHLRAEIARAGAPAALRVLTPGAAPARTYGHLLTPKDGEPESWVVVDQFEEVFTLCRDSRERSHFIDLLLAARNPDSRLRVLIAVRADFYARCAEHRELADALRGAGLPVGPMSAEELREAVVGPAQAAGLLVERDLTARIVDEVQDQPGALPMLSHALLETWRRRRSRMLTLTGYEAVGGVLGAIAATAEDVYGRLSEAEARTARQLLLRLIEPGQGNADTRRPLVRAELDDWNGDDVPVVVDRLARARLVTVDEDGVQLAHEALITCWPRLRGWIEEDRERLRHHRRLTEAARAWLEHDRDPGALYRGSRLVRAEELFADDRSALTAPECAFLTAALAARESERRAVTRTARRSRTLVGALSAVLAVALLIGLAAWQQAEDSQKRRTDDAARRVAEVADGLRTTDPRTAMLLGVAAWRISPLPEARRALLGSLTQPERGTFTDPATAADPVRLLLDSGRTLLSSDGGNWRTWDLATGRHTASGRLPDGGADALVTAGPGARVLAVAAKDGVRLWDATSRHWTGGSPRLAANWANVHFSPDGATFLVSTTEGRVQLRSVADGRLLYATHGSADLSDVASGPDGRLVALCPDGRAPQLWDLRDRRLVHGSWERSRKLCDENSTLVFGGGGGAGGGGGRFAVLSYTGRRPEGNGSTGTSGNTGLRVWDADTGRQVAGIRSLGVDSAAFSPDGTLLATADDTEVRVWRLDGRATTPVFRHALNNQSLSAGLSWVPGRRPVLRYLEERTVHTLDLGPAATSAWRAHPADDVLLSPDGHTLATAERTTGANYRFRLLDTRDGHDLGTLPSPPAPVSDDPSMPVDPPSTLAVTSFSPDGTTFAYGVSAPGVETAPQPITVWDVGRHRALTTLSLPNAGSVDGAVELRLGPAGHRLYVTRVSDVGILDEEVWDVTRHRRTGRLHGLEGMPLAIRPDGGLLVGDNRAVRLPAGKVTRPSLVQGARTGALAFSSDGSLLAAGDWSGRVALWDGDLRRSTGVMRSVFPTALEGGPEGVGALAVSPDRRTLAVAGDQGTLQLWDIPTGQPLGGTLTTPGDAITTLAFAPDSTTLYAGSAYVPLQRYSIDPAGAVRQVCDRAGGHGLTREQWRTYIPDAGFKGVCGT